MSQKGGQRFYYDYRNQLVRAVEGTTNINLKYDALGRRIEKSTGSDSVKYYYDGNHVIEERDGSDNFLKQYIYGNGIDEILRMDKNENGTIVPYYFHTNAINTTTAVTDQNGNIVERYSYDIYGMPIIKNANGDVISQSAIGNEYMFHGRRYDKETNLYYFRARYYDPIMGRFLQTDPMGYRDSMNLYQAFNMNPVNFVDPYGLYDENFHYFVVYFLMRAKGWDHRVANGVAGWSEMVDKFGESDSFTFDSSKCRFFHFPGSTPISATRRNDRDVRIRVRRYAKEFNPRNIDTIIRLGVFLHIYADSWAHEGFTAWRNDEINRRTGSIRPNMGHADAPLGGHAPDVIILNEENKNKAIEAAQYIFKLLPEGSGKKMSWKEIKSDLEWAFKVYKGNLDDIDWDELQAIEVKRLKALIKVSFEEWVEFEPEKFKKMKDIYFKVLKEYGIEE